MVKTYKWLVYDRSSGKLGVKKFIGNQRELMDEIGSNHMVTLLDPITFKELDENVRLTNDWRDVPEDDPRLAYWKLFDIIYDADWYFNGYETGDEFFVDEFCITNEHQVFNQIRKIFKEVR